MSGVWIFDKNGVARLVANPTRESFEQPNNPPYRGTATAPGARPRVLVYLPTNQIITSYSELEQRLIELGWSRYYNPNNGGRDGAGAGAGAGEESDLIQFHRSHDSSHLISLPKSFANFKSHYMYDIVFKNRSFFQVRDHRDCNN